MLDFWPFHKHRMIKAAEVKYFSILGWGTYYTRVRGKCHCGKNVKVDLPGIHDREMFI